MRRSAEYTYAYDTVGNVTQIDDTSDTAGSHNYVDGYDDLNRLTTLNTYKNTNGNRLVE